MASPLFNHRFSTEAAADAAPAADAAAPPPPADGDDDDKTDEIVYEEKSIDLRTTGEPSPKVKEAVALIQGMKATEIVELMSFMKMVWNVSDVELGEAPGDWEGIDNTMAFDDDDDDEGGGGGGAAAAAAPAAEKTTFTLKLKGFDAKAKIKVIKEIRAITGLGLKEAKTAVETDGSVVKEHLTKEEAEKLEKQLVDVGAKVEIE
jgi:large subunit ribosomal protein L7/L12